MSVSEPLATGFGTLFIPPRETGQHEVFQNIIAEEHPDGTLRFQVTPSMAASIQARYDAGQRTCDWMYMQIEGAAIYPARNIPYTIDGLTIVCPLGERQPEALANTRPVGPI